MTEKLSPASLLASMRWAKATEAEKKEVGRKMVEARVKLRKEREATLRAQSIRRRSRKPKTLKPQAE